MKQERNKEVTVESYSQDLLFFITKYTENKIDECISKGYYLEAVGNVFIQISEQLRFLMVKRLKEHEGIHLDLRDERYGSVLKVIKEMKDYQLHELAFVLGRINKRELDQLNRLRKLRNDFSHSFEKRKKYSDEKIVEIINKSRKIERRLKNLVANYGHDNITMNELNR